MLRYLGWAMLVLGCSTTTGGRSEDAEARGDEAAMDTPTPDVPSTPPEDVRPVLDGGAPLDQPQGLDAVVEDAQPTRDQPVTRDVRPPSDRFDPSLFPQCSTRIAPHAQVNSLNLPPSTVVTFGDWPNMEGMPIAATWQGVRTLSQPLSVRCPEGETAHPCTLTQVIVLDGPQNTRLELLTSINLTSLAPLPMGAAVTVRLNGPSAWNGTNLSITDAQGRIVLVVRTGRTIVNRWDIGPLRLSINTVTDAPFCVSPLYPMCNWTTALFPLTVAPAAGETFASVSVAPEGTALVTTSLGRYRVTNRKIQREFNSRCSNPPNAEDHFEIVRIPDGQGQ